MECSARGNTCRGLTWGSSHYARFSNGARDRKSPAKPPRENPVNQSGSVALSAEEVRGPPQTQVVDKNSIFDPYEPGGRGFKSCRARQYSRGYEPQVRSFRGLRDPCGTFYPQNGLARVRDTQHSARFLTIQDEVRLLEQATDIRTRVVASHGMIGVAK